jgi:hypothetical protein
MLLALTRERPRAQLGEFMPAARGI